MAEAEIKKYVVVKLGDEQFGINIRYVENIIVMQSITRIPKSQTYFNGVINLRGEIVPVMSLRGKLGKDADPFHSSTRIIIVKPELQTACVGIIVDEVKEVISLSSDEIEKMNYDGKDNMAKFSKGIGKYKNELINILNVPGIVIDKETKK